jgi:hypothetical protein
MLAHQARVVIGCVIILAFTWFTIGWIGTYSFRQHLRIGAFWVPFTMFFESGPGILSGSAPDRVISDYELSRGCLMGFCLVFMLLAPHLVASFGSNY